jgi:NAD(P)-dependent dehydrogenase (short-subunit alcohol dehydrogenase family)
MKLKGKTVLITGAARRVGRGLALAVAHAGGEVIIHYGHSAEDAEQTQKAIQDLGVTATILQSDLSEPQNAIEIIRRANQISPIFALVNNAAIFESVDWSNCDLET